MIVNQHRAWSSGRRGRPARHSPPDYPALVERIRDGDPAGMEQLYSLFSRGVRFYLCRQLGPQELEDKVHDTFLIVVQAIQRGELREPERLMGFVRTIVRRQVAASIDSAIQNRREHAELECGFGVCDERANPEEDAIARQEIEIMTRLLESISPRDREILTRFYLYGQGQDEICRDMHLTDTQFRLLKSRAKTRFAELGRRRLRIGLFSRILLRLVSRWSH